MKRKSNLLVLLMLIFILPAMQAQIGVRVGANLASQTIEGDGVSPDTKLKFGFGVGLFYQHNINDNFSIQPELNFMQMGSKFELELSGESIEATVDFNYVHIPILAKYAFGNMDALNFYVQGGPYLGLGIGKIKTMGCVGGECEEGEDFEYGDGEDGPKRLEFGGQLGAGVNITQNISVDARYVLGLNNLITVDNAILKNNSIFISVGYKI